MHLDARAIRLNLVLCSILHGLNHYLLIFYKPMYPQMASFFGLTSVAEVTTRLTVAYLGYGLSNFLTGVLAKRVNLKYVLFGGMVVMSLSASAVAFAPAAGYGWAVLFAFLMGLGGGTYHPAANTLMTSLYESKQGHAIGMLSIGSAVGFAAAPLIGTHLGRDILGFRCLFLASGLAAFLFAWIFLAFVRSVPPLGKRPAAEDKNQANGLTKAALAIVIVLLAAPALLRDTMNWGYYEVTPYWVDNGFTHGIGVDVIQLMAYLPGLLVQPLTGKLCDRFGPFAVVIATFAVMSAGYVFFAFPSPVLLWLGLACYGIGLSATTVANETYMASIVSAGSRGIVYGIVLSFALAFGGFLGGASGLIIDHFGKHSLLGYRFWFAGMGILTGASIACYFIIETVRRKKRIGPFRA
ncbi:MAG: MFS transporter [Spirochaetales bacterium]|nr:MFS transporter [Spirochaetales bacterium]